MTEEVLKAGIETYQKLADAEPEKIVAEIYRAMTEKKQEEALRVYHG